MEYYTLDTRAPEGSYIIDLTVRDARARECTPSRLERALKRNGEADCFKDLIGDYDTPVFHSKAEADAFLETYSRLLAGLSNKKICQSRELPAILYKRRYMIQTLMGLKPQTFRNYEKSWQPGELFNLHDQVFFLTVRLKKITPVKGGDFKYEFELP